MRAARSRNASIAAPSSSDDNIGPTERSRKGSAGQSVPPVPSSSGGQAVPMGKAAADPSNAALKNATRRPSIEEVVDDETVMANVEEMLEGFEWRGGMGGTASGSGLGKADEIEKRLIGELKALDAVSGESAISFTLAHCLEIGVLTLVYAYRHLFMPLWKATIE